MLSLSVISLHTAGPALLNPSVNSFPKEDMDSHMRLAVHTVLPSATFIVPRRISTHK